MSGKLTWNFLILHVCGKSHQLDFGGVDRSELEESLFDIALVGVEVDRGRVGGNVAWVDRALGGATDEVAPLEPLDLELLVVQGDSDRLGAEGEHFDRRLHHRMLHRHRLRNQATHLVADLHNHAAIGRWSRHVNIFRNLNVNLN